jgi:hypothetical protein
MNYISYNEELKEIENKLKELTEKYQQDYAERGKYIKSKTAQATILCLNYILTLVIFIKLDDLSRIICVAIYGLIVSFVLIFGKNIKLPIVSKKSYVKKVYPKLKFDLKSNYNLDIQNIAIDYDKIEFSLNQKDLSKLRKK